MKSDTERCAEQKKFMKIGAAFRVGDLGALRSAVDDPASVPNGPMPVMIGSCLEYAIYHSPLPFIRTLLEIDADPNPADHAGFPPLIAELSCRWPRPGSPGRPDVLEILQLLLAFKSDPNQSGINDYTPLHMAVSEHDLRAVDLLCKPARPRASGQESTIAKRLERWRRRRVFTRLQKCLPCGRRSSAWIGCRVRKLRSINSRSGGIRA